MNESTLAPPGLLSNKPYVDRKLSAALSATLFGRRFDNWYVYLAYDRCQMLRYVGQTGVVFSRFSQHRTSGRLGGRACQQADDWSEVVAIACRNEGQVKALERKLIHFFHPPDNRKCETPGCRHYLDGKECIPVRREAVSKNLSSRGIEPK